MKSFSTYSLLLLLLLMVPVTAQTIPPEVAGKVNNIFSWNAPDMFAFQLEGYTNWFVVREATVGTTHFERIHVQLLDALVHEKVIWAGTTGVEVTIPNPVPAWEIWGTTIGREW